MLNNLQFPQPTKPAHAQDFTGQADSTNFVAEDDDHQPQNYYYYYNYSDSDEEKTHDHKFLKKLYAKVEEEITSLKTSVEDGDQVEKKNKILGLFKKFGAKLHKKLSMKRSDDHGVIIQEREVVGIEVDQKLERFKVRTVNLGGGGGGQGEEDNADQPPKTQN